LGQVNVPDGSNEITAVPEILRRLNVEGCIVTVDALNCQETIAAQIREQKADYLLALKDNHNGLRAEVEGFLTSVREDRTWGFEISAHQTTDGVGKLVALRLAGTSVLLHGRNKEKGEDVLRAIRNETGNDRLEYYQADFSSLDEARRLAEAIEAKHDRLEILINNAGIGATTRGKVERETSRDGHELRFAVNYLAPFLLTHMLLPLIRKSAPARIVNVASAGQQRIDFSDVMLTRGYDGERWGWPGSRPEDDESWEQTLRREVLEEACAAVVGARLLGFCRSARLTGPEQCLVLARSIWLAEIELMP
jgi:NAD(P)-dependent dehydrogenase (short-subunit alcohol dehydrogenase family)